MKRVSSLDYLRGLAAFGIVAFHYKMWLTGLIMTNPFLGKAGIYGVSVFYVLSGLTLFHVYYDKIGTPSRKGITDFTIKRIFRIFPLLWLLSIATMLLHRDDYTTQNIILSFTGLFGLWHWDDTIIYGAWSIGNELVFYIFFPVFIFLSHKPRIWLVLFTMAMLLLYLWFAFLYMYKAIAEGNFWEAYTNPLNNVFLFLGGYLIGLFTVHIAVPRAMTISLAVVASCIFIWLPVSGDATHLIVGWYRVIFTVLCFAICFAFYKTDFGLPIPLHRIFEKLGEISYCLYLVHPLLWYVLSHQFGKYISGLSIPFKVLTGFSLSILIAWAIYQLFEKPFMKAGKRVSEMLAR